MQSPQYTDIYAQEDPLDRGMFVHFEYKSVPDPEGEAATGLPKKKYIERVQMRSSGSSDDVWKDVTQDIIDRFPVRYAKWKRMYEPPEEGYPLMDWPPISRADIDMFYEMGIKTVEKLASLSEKVLNQYPLLRIYTEKAKTWLKNSQDGSEVVRLTTENLQLKADLKASDEQLNKLNIIIRNLNDKLVERQVANLSEGYSESPLPASKGPKKKAFHVSDIEDAFVPETPLATTAQIEKIEKGISIPKGGF